MPPNTVKVTRPGPWGNPFAVTATQDAKAVVGAYRTVMRGSQSKVYASCKDEDGQPNPIGALQLLVWRNTMLKRLPELRGKNLACWCPLDAKHCHADVLLKLANR